MICAATHKLTNFPLSPWLTLSAFLRGMMDEDKEK